MKTAALQKWILCEEHFSTENLSSVFFITTVWIYKSAWIQRVSSAVIKSEHGTGCSLLNLHNSFNILMGKKGKDGIKSNFHNGLSFWKKDFSSRMSEKSQSPFSSHFQWVYNCVKTKQNTKQQQKLLILRSHLLLKVQCMGKVVCGSCNKFSCKLSFNYSFM